MNDDVLPIHDYPLWIASYCGRTLGKNSRMKGTVFVEDEKIGYIYDIVINKLAKSEIPIVNFLNEELKEAHFYLIGKNNVFLGIKSAYGGRTASIIFIHNDLSGLEKITDYFELPKPNPVPLADLK